MRAIAARRALWILGALFALDALVAFAYAGSTLATTTPIVAGLVVAVALLIVAANVRRAAWDPRLHASGRWVALDAMRIASVVAALAFVLLSVSSILLTEGARIYEAWMLALPAAVFVMALIGAAMETSTTAATSATTTVSARRVYATPTGAVVTTAGGTPLVVGPAGEARRLTDIERAIDARRWTKAATPAPNELRSALQRWGDIIEPRE